MASHDIGIIGLGYVGLTLGTALADVGMKVIGLEKRAEVVELINRGKAHFQERGLDDILALAVSRGKLEARTEFLPADVSDCYVITVGTPLDKNGIVRLDMIENATRQVAAAMPENALIILRSTVKVGTARNVVAPILTASGKKYQLAMCPERTLEGNAMTELRKLPQIVGADDEATRERAARLFHRLTAQVLTVSSLETAEIIKLADNTYRDVSFAFGNEIARLCDAVGVSAHEVISTGKLGYSRTNIAIPGLVGGPCLSKDPHILCQSGEAYGLELDISRASRVVNERQPMETAQFISAELDRRSAPADAVVTFLGLAFKGVPETDDLRGAMSLSVIDAIKALRPKARLRAHDPVIRPADIAALGLGLEVCEDVLAAIAGTHCAIITNNHPYFSSLGFSTITSKLAPRGFVYDYWGHFSDVDVAGPETNYFAVGSVRRRPKE